jgi:hypothetical protein
MFVEGVVASGQGNATSTEGTRYQSEDAVALLEGNAIPAEDTMTSTEGTTVSVQGAELELCN